MLWVSLGSSYLKLFEKPRSGYLFFLQVREIFSDYFFSFLLFSLSFFSETTVMWMLVYLMLSLYKFLKPSSLFFMFFFFTLLIGWLPLPCFLICWSFILLDLADIEPFYWIFHCSVFFCTVISVLCLYFLCLCWISHFVLALFFWSWYASLWS